MLISLVSFAFALEGTGKSTIVWMSPELPAPEIRAKAEKLVGASASHASWSDIAFPATPFGKEDEARLAGVERARADGRAKWDGFDVEKDIAAGIESAVSTLDVLRDDADRKTLAAALLIQGAAVNRLVPEANFSTAESVGPFRVFLGSTAAMKPFVNALALEPDATWEQADLLETAAITRFGSTRVAADASGRAKLELAPMPTGVTLVVDGRPLTGASAELWPGRHYVHAMVNGAIAGRQVVEASAAGTVTVEPSVNREELDAASARVLEGSKDLPEDVVTAVNALGKRTGAPTPTFVATLDDKGRVQVVPFGGGAAFQKKAAVTVILHGSVGGAAILSSAFVGKLGDPSFGYGVGGNLGVEVGIYNLAIYGGSSLILTPSEGMKFANAEGTENNSSSAYFRPFGGLGVYLPRPDARKALFLIGADYGWMSPGSMGVGGRVSVGIPSGDGTWFRIELDAMGGTQMKGFPAEGEPTVSAGVRLGFGRKL